MGKISQTKKKKLLAGLGLFMAMSFCPLSASASVGTFSAVGEYTMNDEEEPRIAEQRSIDTALSSAAEKAVAYIEKYARAKKWQIEKDEIRALASNNLRTSKDGGGSLLPYRQVS